MAAHNHSDDLLQVVEVEDHGTTRYLLCFLSPEDAGQGGFPDQSIVGEFETDPDVAFDPARFQANTLFLEAFVAYMNDQAISSPELLARARERAGHPIYLLDPRINELDLDGDPDPSEILGGFEVDDDGNPVPNSFRYNPQHVLFNIDSVPSGILTDVQFYDWMHSPRDR